MRSLPQEQLQALVTSELFPPKDSTAHSKPLPRLKDSFDTYVREHKVNWREKSHDEVTYSLELALDVIGNVETSHLSSEVIKSYLAAILRLPANHKKKPALRNLSISEILKLDGLSPMSRKSVCKHMQWLGAALKHANMEHLLDGVVLPTVTRNPYEERSVYSVEELQRIIDNLTWDEDHPDRLWVPLIGLLQGMRLNEICQLHVHDVSLDGLPTISINDDEDIRELFEQEFATGGGEVKVTQASRDGGVDAVAFDPDPIRGGKIVIQAKRYANTVGVSAVRDLYGTVMNEGAIKGILVTTADYGPDAYEFAKGKPLTLLNGSNLLHLLEKHGRQARINLHEARQENRQAMLAGGCRRRNVVLEESDGQGGYAGQ